MSQRILWKLILTGVLVAWALFTLYPYSDRPFDQFVKDSATAKPAEFNKVLERTKERQKANPGQSTFVALKQLGREEQLDLTQFFPNVPMGGVSKIEKRNDILLDYLLKESKRPLQLGLDLRGGVAFTLEAVLPPDVQSNDYARKARLDKAVEIISNRINAFGVAEPIVRAIGENRIEVQLPGVSTKDNPEVLNVLKKPARLDFRLAHPQFAHMPQPIPAEQVPVGYELMPMEVEARGTTPAQTVWYAIKLLPEMTGESIEHAGPRVNDFGQYEISLSFNSKGAKRFADVTTANVNRGLGIVLDGKLYSAPNINGPITGGNASITGGFGQREAQNLSDALNNPLQDRLEVKTQYEVGPSLAQDAIDSGVKASIIGATLVAAFMITYYSVGGVIAVLSLVVNVLLILGSMAMFGATISMPGLAGIVLTIGMAVDANILVFERMRDELNLGKSLKSALVSGYDKAFITILDSHITQLLICGVMIWKGTGPVKGFGVTLAIGVFSTLISVLISSHFVMEWLIGSDIMKRFPMLHLLKNVQTDFVKYGKACFIGSWVIVLGSLGFVVIKGDRIYGTDFTGGDIVSVEYKQKLDAKQIREVAEAAHLGDVVPTYVSPLGGGKEILKIETSFDKGGPLVEALQKKYPAAELKNVGEDRIGATVGKEIEWNALISVALSMLVILVYVAFRFEFGFGIGAVVASVHDILMTIGIFVLCGYQFSAPMVAAILSIAGYSINDTIVVFDRIREELKSNPDSSLRDVINLALRRVFSRSIMTSLTTFLAALSLFIFGTGVMKDLSFTFLVGIITGTFSSIYIAAPVFYWWHKGDRRHVEAHKDIAPKYEWVGASKASR